MKAKLRQRAESGADAANLPSGGAIEASPLSSLSPAHDWGVVTMPSIVTGLCHDARSGELFLCFYKRATIVVLSSSTYRVLRVLPFVPHPDDISDEAVAQPIKIASAGSTIAVIMWSIYRSGPREGSYHRTALYVLDKVSGALIKQFSFSDAAEDKERLVLRVAALADGTIFLVTGPPFLDESDRKPVYHHVLVLSAGLLNVAHSFESHVPFTRTAGIGVAAVTVTKEAIPLLDGKIARPWGMGILQLTEQSSGTVFCYSQDGTLLAKWCAGHPLTGTVAVCGNGIPCTSPPHRTMATPALPLPPLTIAYDATGRLFDVVESCRWGAGASDPGEVPATLSLSGAATKVSDFTSPQAAAFDPITATVIVSLSYKGRHALALRRLLASECDPAAAATGSDGSSARGLLPAPMWGPVPFVAPALPAEIRLEDILVTPPATVG